MHSLLFNYSRWGKYAIVTFSSLIVLYLCLLFPDSEVKSQSGFIGKPFLWNQDAKWEEIESRFMEARNISCDSLEKSLQFRLKYGLQLNKLLSLRGYNISDSIFNSIEENIFSLSPMVGACPDYVMDFVRMVVSMRDAVKYQSKRWNFDSVSTRIRLYRLLYGGRAAIEEVMLQACRDTFPSTVLCRDESSHTPSANILGVRIHSGDILVSRGGAPTSALIARGNDYQGNFSHIALAYVDSGNINIIESHIEKGVTVSSIDDYLRDKKLRVMVLRLHSNLPALINDPMLPHKAASRMLEYARFRHIPYDFSMDLLDTSKMFCSEVVSYAYRHYGMTLWRGISTISSAGTASWLAAFGVEHFETQEPSDLEYDPQLSVVAEWRDREALFKDHIDNAVIEAMLEGAERGDQLSYDWYMLPIARVLKMYSVLANLFGGIGPIPEGMNATAALKNRNLTICHAKITTEVFNNAEIFQKRFGYVPPYWELLKLARQSVSRYHESHN
jgi:hypothetical protein